MPTTVRSLCAYFFSFSLGLASALPLSLLLRRALQGRAASPRQSAMSWLPSGQYDEQTLASAKHAMSYVRPKLRRPLMEPVWDAGFDLLAGLDGVGVQSTLSCTSSIGSQEGTRRSRTTRAQGRQVYSSSCQCTGPANSTHATPGRTSPTEPDSTEGLDGLRGGFSNLTYGVGWPD